MADCAKPATAPRAYFSGCILWLATSLKTRLMQPHVLLPQRGAHIEHGVDQLAEPAYRPRKPSAPLAKSHRDWSYPSCSSGLLMSNRPCSTGCRKGAEQALADRANIDPACDVM
jgi:hypothetical protein